MLGGLKW
jgi:hypothetical protein